MTMNTSHAEDCNFNSSFESRTGTKALYPNIGTVGRVWTGSDGIKQDRTGSDGFG